ncbi:restriction endonuclease subunit S [Staphylococcus saprophyticus]|uniref:restriction endonuclease subunit S n=1 Tax=Staphylococcus saprophyticus TaxID=29385 RepID=UPI00157C3878|nr:restriction endonuclease subunit S [Staphylococcus saprophyticus]MDW4090033.1 restriction endonuclease subunit S [Staphylococcus saprophyticus]MDW4278338.1 restriction endonuclease subunit S [Staphylococcus saprophyticus]QKQ01972.1 restriction endonuclease subunit S [Staphylococcus saprophyticus]
MTNDTKNVPELRFPGFSGEWEIKELGDRVKFYSGLTYTPNDVSKNGTLVLRSSNIFNNHIINADNVYVNSDKATSTYVEYGDVVVVVRNGSRNLIGKHAVVKKEETNAVIGAFMTGIRYEFGSFINALLSTQNFQKEIHKNLGATINQITTGIFKKMPFSFPKKQEEQKIGEFFSKLDRQIELEEQKLEKLEEQKRGYMQKIFSQELRFKDENGQEYPAWINKKLGDIGKVSMNKRIYKNETSINGEIPFYKIGTFGKEAETFISREKFEEYKNKYPYPEKGDILISASGSIGRTIEYDGEEAYYQDSNIVWLDHNDEVLNIFLKYIYSVIKWSGIEGTTIKRLYNKDILNTKIDLPVIKEQEKIGNFFGKIDDSIEKQSSKIGVLKQRKKGFLQKMFV